MKAVIMSLKRENGSSDGDSRDLKKAKSSDVGKFCDFICAILQKKFSPQLS